jgi:uncharacterized protein (TIGR03000 family)
MRSLFLLLMIPATATAQDAKVKVAWAWATAKPVSAWAIAPVKLPPQKCSCKPCTCTPCKCDPAKTPRKIVPDKPGAVPCPDCDRYGLEPAVFIKGHGVPSKGLTDKPCGYCQGKGYAMIDAGNSTTTWAKEHPELNRPESDYDAPITLKLTVPNTARVWLQGQEMPGTGSYREFISPPMKAGKEWVYTIKVRDAYGSEETVEIPLRSGQTRELNFRAPEVPLIETRLPPIQFGQPIPFMPMGSPCPPGGG